MFALLAGTATTFSVATPLMASVVEELLHIDISRSAVTIIILLLTCFVYTYSLLHGFKGISILAKICIYMFFALLAYVLKQDFPHWERCLIILSNYLHLQIRREKPLSHRIGRSIIGHIGWYGALPPPSLLEIFQEEELSDKRFSVAMDLAWALRWSAL